MTRKAYHQEALRLYRQLPDTPQRFHHGDRAVVDMLLEQGVTLSTIEAALLLGAARRACRDPSLHKLEPIRSIAYFLPVIREIPHTNPPDGYLDYLRQTLRITTPAKNDDSRSQPTTLSRSR